MRIGIDIMGGDFFPQKTVHGAILALKELSPNEQIILIGNKNVLFEKMGWLGRIDYGYITYLIKEKFIIN